MFSFIRQFLIIVFILFTSFVALAEKKEHKTKHSKVVLSAGYGAPSIIRTFLKKNTNKTEFDIEGYGPWMLKADYFFNKKWSIGLNLSYSFSRISWLDDGLDTAQNIMRKYEYGIEMEEYSALLRTNYHFKQTQKIDAYVGMGIGYGSIALGTYTLAPVNEFPTVIKVPKPLSFEATVGARYFVTKHIGLYSEIGLGKAWLLLERYFIPESVFQAGVCVKF
jgi:opacity protein-like surface antigen